MSLTETPSHRSLKQISPEAPGTRCPLLSEDARENIVARAIFASILRANGLDETRYAVHIMDHEKSLEVEHSEDGGIYIPLALYRKARTRAALAFMLSHELAHHIHGDVEDSVSILGGKDSCRERESRERRADITGLDLYKKAGYDTSLAIEFVEEIEKSGEKTSEDACHIDPRERLALLQKAIPKKPKQK